jgi:hypothetical protein
MAMGYIIVHRICMHFRANPVHAQGKFDSNVAYHGAEDFSCLLVTHIIANYEMFPFLLII